MSDEWAVISLGDVATLQRGVSYTSGQLEPPGKEFATIKCIAKGGGFRSEELKTFAGMVSVKDELHRDDLIIANTDLTRDGSIVGAPAIVPEVEPGATFSMDVSRLNLATARVDRHFLAARLQLADARAFMQAISGGSTVIHLRTSEVPRFVFSLPPLGEQRRIAEILDVLDDQIRITVQILTTLAAAREGLVADLTSKGVEKPGVPRARDQRQQVFRDSVVGPVPARWDVAPLASRRSASRPYLKTGPFGSSLKQEHWVDDGVPVVTIGSLGSGAFIESELLHVSGQTAKILSAYALDPGDIVFSRVADVGRSAVVTEKERGWIMSSNMMWISLDPMLADPQFVQVNIGGNPWVRRQIRRYVNSAGRDVANARVMNLLQFPWPSIDEQRAIVEIIADFDQQVAAERRQLEKLRVVKGGLMIDLLAGRVHVPREAAS